MARIWFVVLILCCPRLAVSQDSPLSFKQVRDGETVQMLTSIEFATLGDPLFNAVLKAHADKTSLEAVMDAIQPNVANRQVYVVDERIVSQVQTNASRRIVISFTGNQAGEDLQGNVMLSTFLLANGSVTPSIEAWGWDNLRGRYNYYKLDGAGAPPGKQTWKFRNSSADADLLTPAERTGTCLRCHTNGAPVMKELVFPWNNWHSAVGNAFKAEYLDPNSSNPNKWPAASSSLMSNLKGAESLETDHIIPALNRFVESRFNAMLLRDDATGNRLEVNGRLTLTNAKRLLRSLFVPTEVNLISSDKVSGIHPFGSPSDFVPSQSIRVPEGFFLNSALIAGGAAGGGLQLNSGKKFKNLVQLTQSENKSFCEKFGLRLNGSVGDTQFAWLIPSQPYHDARMVNHLLNAGAVSTHFLAAVLAIDVENPLFSDDRASLLKYLPDSYTFEGLEEGTDPTSLVYDPDQDELAKKVIAKIQADSPASNSVAAQFLQLLQSNHAVEALDQKVEAYVTRTKTNIESAADRPAEMERLFKLLMERRQRFQQNTLFSPLDETEGKLLFPFPP